MSNKGSSSFLSTTLALLFSLSLLSALVYIYSTDWLMDRKIFWTLVVSTGFFAGSTFFLVVNRGDSLDKETNKLIVQQALFSELYQNSPVPYIRTNRQGEVIGANAAAVHLYGRELNEFVGQDLFSLVYSGDDDVDRIERVFRLALSGNFINDKEMIFRRPDGVEHWVLLSAFPYAHKTEMLVTLVDITKQKAVDAAKTEFVSLASHQLRTPISAMKWNLDLLSLDKVGSLNDKQKVYVDKLKNSVGKMTVMIKDFLDASQLEMGTFASTISEVSLTEFITGQLEEFDARIASKRLVVDTRFPESETVIETDSHLLRMTVNNLISNAVKYTPSDGTIVVGYVAGASAVSITVRDSGVGIPLGEQERLFSKFYRASNVAKTSAEGTGIGLYIVKQAVEMMRGSITLESEENRGAEFVVTLPLRQ